MIASFRVLLVFLFFLRIHAIETGYKLCCIGERVDPQPYYLFVFRSTIFSFLTNRSELGPIRLTQRSSTNCQQSFWSQWFFSFCTFAGLSLAPRLVILNSDGMRGPNNPSRETGWYSVCCQPNMIFNNLPAKCLATIMITSVHYYLTFLYPLLGYSGLPQNLRIKRSSTNCRPVIQHLLPHG